MSPIASSHTASASSSSPIRPGHEQYTRNMATGASTADLAVLLVDARKGVLTQTRRHSYHRRRCSASATSSLVVNKMDLVGWRERDFERIMADYLRLRRRPRLCRSSPAFPLSALHGDNVTRRSDAMDWYAGRRCWNISRPWTSLERELHKPFRMPVQWVNRAEARISAAFAAPLLRDACGQATGWRSLPPAGRSRSRAS